MRPLSSVPAPDAQAVADWKHLYTDARAWTPLLAEILRRERLGTLDSVEVGVPGSNAVFIVNGRLVVKIQWPHYLDDLPRELEAHRLLEPHREVRAPRVLAAGAVESELTWHYLIQERLPGRSLGEVRGHLPRRDLDTIASALGEMIAVLHALPVPTAGPLTGDCEQWFGFLQAQVERAAQHHAPSLTQAPHLLSELPSYLAGAMPLAPPDFRLAVLHCDLTADHVLVAEREGGWRVTGLIDFGDVMAGHADYEWIALHLDCFAADAALTQRFLRSYGYGALDEAFPRRLTAYSFLHRFGDAGFVLGAVGGPRAVGSLAGLERRLWGPVLTG